MTCRPPTGASTRRHRQWAVGALNGLMASWRDGVPPPPTADAVSLTAKLCQSRRTEAHWGCPWTGVGWLIVAPSPSWAEGVVAPRHAVRLAALTVAVAVPVGCHHYRSRLVPGVAASTPRGHALLSTEDRRRRDITQMLLDASNPAPCTPATHRVMWPTRAPHQVIRGRPPPGLCAYRRDGGHPGRRRSVVCPQLSGPQATRCHHSEPKLCRTGGDAVTPDRPAGTVDCPTRFSQATTAVTLER